MSSLMMVVGRNTLDDPKYFSTTPWMIQGVVVVDGGKMVVVVSG